MNTSTAKSLTVKLPQQRRGGPGHAIDWIDIGTKISPALHARLKELRASHPKFSLVELIDGAVTEWLNNYDVETSAPTPAAPLRETFIWVPAPGNTHLELFKPFRND